MTYQPTIAPPITYLDQRPVEFRCRRRQLTDTNTADIIDQCTSHLKPAFNCINKIIVSNGRNVIRKSVCCRPTDIEDVLIRIHRERRIYVL